MEWEQQGEELLGCLFPCPHGFGATLLKAKSTAALREMQNKWGFKALGLENLKPRLPHHSCYSSKPKLLGKFDLMRAGVRNFIVSRGENSHFLIESFVPALQKGLAEASVQDWLSVVPVHPLQLPVP